MTKQKKDKLKELLEDFFQSLRQEHGEFEMIVDAYGNCDVTDNRGNNIRLNTDIYKLVDEFCS